MHFLLECKCFVTHRKDLFEAINEKNKDIDIQFYNKNEQFIYLLSNIDIISHTAHYLDKAFLTREYLLKKHKIFI